jgi:hypothetical protein
MAIQKAFLLITSLTALTSTGLWAAEDPFAGTWRLNRAKSQIAGQRQQIRDLGGNNY